MATMISCDASAWFYLLLFGLLFAAAMATRHGGRSPTRVDVRGVGRLPARLYRIEDGPPQGLTGHDSGRMPLKGSYAAVLEVYGRQFEEAIERIRLDTMGSRGRKGK